MPAAHVVPMKPVNDSRRRFMDVPAPFAESNLLHMPPLKARDLALKLPVSTRFTLRDDITPLQFAFLDLHGFLVFAGVARPVGGRVIV